MKLHNDNSFPCNYLNCKKSFPALVNLNRHKRLCHGIRQKCSKCERSFANPGNLKRHSKTIHHGITSLANDNILVDVPNDTEPVGSVDYIIDHGNF